MVLPITGPVTKDEYLLGPPNSYGFKPRIYAMQRVSYRQKPPYDLPLDFSYILRRVTSYRATERSGGNDDTYYLEVTSLPSDVDADPQLYAKCYQKFKEKVGSRASLGIAVAEGKEALGMIEKRSLQLARFSRALAQGKFGVAASHLGVRVYTSQVNRMTRRRLRYGAKAFADNYLEFHFGWSPLMSDIHDSMEALSKPYRPHEVSARVRGKIDAGSFYSKETTISSSITERATYRTNIQDITLRCDMQVQNPNLALAEQMGLINPATILWEKIPFSFVVDWFVNVGDFLGQFTDFSGLYLTKQSRTIFTRHDWSETMVTSYPPSEGYTTWTNITQSGKGYGVYDHRITGAFPDISLFVRHPWVLSPRRGLAAVSLLIQRLRKP